MNPLLKEIRTNRLLWLLIVAYGLGLLFSLKTHRELLPAWDPGNTTRHHGR